MIPPLDIGDICRFSIETKALEVTYVTLIFVVGTIFPFFFVDEKFWERSEGKLWRVTTLLFEKPVQVIPICLMVFGVGLGLFAAYGDKYCKFHFVEKPYEMRKKSFSPIKN